MKTCFISMRLAIGGFVLPFLFLYRPALLLQGPWYETVWSILMVAVFMFAFIIAVEGFFLKKMKWQERVLAAVSAVCFLWPVYVLDFVGIVLFAALILWHVSSYRKSTPAQPAPQEA